MSSGALSSSDSRFCLPACGMNELLSRLIVERDVPWRVWGTCSTLQAPTLCHNNFALFFCVHFHMERTGRPGKEEYGTGKQGDKENKAKSSKGRDGEGVLMGDTLTVVVAWAKDMVTKLNRKSLRAQQARKESGSLRVCSHYPSLCCTQTLSLGHVPNARP